METTPRPMDSWIPLLGLAILIVAGVGTHPKILQADRIPVVHVVLLAAAAAAGIAAILSKRLRPRLVHRPALIALGVYCVYVGFDVLRYQYFANTFLLVGNTGHLLQIAGTPLLWGLALSRREEPTH